MESDRLYKCYAGVELGPDAQIGEFTVLGLPARDHKPGEQRTQIGARAVIRSHTVIYAGTVIGDDFQTGHGVLVREANKVADRVSIGSHTVIEHHVLIGNDVRIHSNAFVPEYSVLETGCWVGPNVVMTNALYPLSPAAKEKRQGPRIEPQAKIGANATLLPGVVIGAYALVGAGAVVVRDAPPGKVLVGNPARVVGDVSDLEAYAIEEFTNGPGSE